MVTVGVIGGGQLCRMMGEEIQRKNLPFELIALDPTPECPAYPFLKEQLVGDFSDPVQIHQLARRSDILTYEIELAGADVLESLERKGKIVQPSSRTLGIIQDKYEQFEYLDAKGIPVPESYKVRQKEDVQICMEMLGRPVMLKARMGSYDGRGNHVVSDKADIDAAFAKFGNRPLMAQKFINFTNEISVIAARNPQGEIATYPVGENIHHNNILHTTIVPARISKEVADNAQRIATMTLEVLEGAGVYGIEMFVDPAGEVYVNEVAPRVHNSGHYTIEGCETSQFEQHLRAISGLPLGSTKLLYDGVIMHNILGDDTHEGEYKLEGADAVRDAGGHFHWYGKREIRKDRKMGHITVVPQNGYEKPEELIERAAHLRSLLRFTPR